MSAPDEQPRNGRQTTVARSSPRQTSLGISQGQLAIRLAITTIGNGNYEQLEELLEMMDLSQVDINNSDTLLAILLTHCWQYDQPEAARVVLEQWRRVYPQLEEIPFYAKLINLPYLNERALQFVMSKVYPEISLYKVVTELMPDHATQISLALGRGTETFGQLSYEEATNLRQIADDALNAPIANFLYWTISQLAPYQNIPPWMRNFTQQKNGSLTEPWEAVTIDTDLKRLGTFEELYREPVVRKMPNMDLVGWMQLIERNSVLNEADIDLETTEDILEAGGQEAMSVRQRWWDIAQSRVRQGNLTLFRFYGPANPYPNEFDPVWGGSRMFLDVRHNNDGQDQDDTRVTDWYDGFCHQCLLRIRRRWHAVRMPLPGGGWAGCFCSWNCVRLASRTPLDYEAPLEMDSLTEALIAQFEQQINAIGIQDRSTDGDIIAAQGYNDPLPAAPETLLLADETSVTKILEDVRNGRPEEI